MTKYAELDSRNIKIRYSKVHSCERCGGNYLKFLGKEQKICGSCLKETGEFAVKFPTLDELYPVKIIPPTSRPPISQREHLSNKALVGESGTGSWGQDYSQFFKHARHRGFKDPERRDKLIKFTC